MSSIRTYTLGLATIIAALQAAAVPGSCADIAVTDPVAAVRSIYSAKDATSGLGTAYEIATRRLRKAMMATNLCTVPFARRVIVCTDTLGLLAPTTDVGPALDDPRSGTRSVTVTAVSGDLKAVRYTFARGPAGWQLDGILASGLDNGPLAPVATAASDESMAPAASALSEAPPAIVSAAAASRRADRQRRLTRQN